MTYSGSCLFCDFECDGATPIDVNLAIIRHKCERKYKSGGRDLASIDAGTAEGVPGDAGRVRSNRDDVARRRLR